MLKKIMAFELVKRILCALEVCPPMRNIGHHKKKKWLAHKWLYLWNYREFFSAENFVGILGIHLPCLDAFQTPIGPEGAENFTQLVSKGLNLQRFCTQWCLSQGIWSAIHSTRFHH